jgi:hypothetical protein
VARNNDDFNKNADELLAARRPTLHPFGPPAGVTLQQLEPPSGITLRPFEPPTDITLRPLDLPGAMANPTRQANGSHPHTTNENAPAAATGDGAPHET